MSPGLPSRYEPTRVIGEGATAVVWHANDRVLDTEVAIKVVKPVLAMHRRYRARFAREVALSARVVHPHVVPVYDTGVTTGGEPFVALGFAVGGSLAELMHVGPPREEMLRLMLEVLDALAAIHALRMLHQDLKPANVLLVPRVDGQVHAWVADLGVADTLAELNRDRRGISGTPAYMAPEQLEARAQDLGPWTDLYAFGIILHEILSGARPQPGEGRAELAEARRRAPPPLVGVSEPLVELVGCLLHPDPRQRFDRAADVRVALREAMAGRSFRLRAPTPLVRARPNADTPLSIVPSRAGVGVPPWNRVMPGPMPLAAPPESGWGAPARASLSLFGLRDVPLVAREKEQKVLWQAAREVVGLGEPRVVLIVGESGSGKTRLAEWLSRALEEGGWMEAVWLRYHDPPGIDDGYRGAVRDLLVPWNDNPDGITDRLTRWLARDERSNPTEVHERAAILARWCGYFREGEAPVHDSCGLISLYRHVEARSWRGGSCLVLEDAHSASADGDGLAIASSILEKAAGARPVLVVATVSAEALAADAGLRRRVESLQERGARRIGLRRLGFGDTRKVVQETLLLEPELARLIAAEFEGNPLAANMLMREWAARRVLVPRDGGFALSPEITLEAAFPSGIDALVRRRLMAAVATSPDPAAAAEALAAAALAGQEPPSAVIRAVNDAGVDALLASGVLSEENGYLTFEHSRLRLVAVDLARQIPDVARVHLALAEAWGSQGASAGFDVDFALGHHWLRAGEPERAIGSLLAATRRLIQGGRARHAIWSAVLAIEASDRIGQVGTRLEARRLHAEALLGAGEPERALPLLEYALAEVEQDRLGRARLRSLMARAARRLGDTERASRELEAASVVFQALRDRDGQLEVAEERALLAENRGDYALATDHWAEALRLNRGDIAGEARARAGMVEALVRAGRIDHIDAQVDRLRRVARASADTRRVGDAFFVVGLLHHARRELEPADVSLQIAVSLATALGEHRLLLRARALQSEVARLRGDLVAAEEIDRALARRASELRSHAEAASALLRLASGALAAGQTARGFEDVRAAEEQLQLLPGHRLELDVQVFSAWRLAEMGDARGARGALDRAYALGLRERYHPGLWAPLQRVQGLARGNLWTDVEISIIDAVENDPRSSPGSAEIVDQTEDETEILLPGMVRKDEGRSDGDVAGNVPPERHRRR